MAKKFFRWFWYLWYIVPIVLFLLVLGALFPHVSGYQMRVVESGSMSPTISTGAVVFVRAIGYYEPGDIITFQRTGDTRATTHRIISVRAQDGVLAYAVRGDANDTNDSRSVATPEIIGKVVFSVPYVGYIFAYLRGFMGFALQ